MGRSFLIGWVLLASAFAMAKPRADEGAYQRARSSYYALKKDTQKRKLRQQWLLVAQKFDDVAARFPKSPRAPDALFTAADMYSELSRISGQKSDLKAAMRAYQGLVKAYPKNRLADDALLALVRILLERQGDESNARKTLVAGLKRVAVGDRRRELGALKQALRETPPAHPSPIVLKAIARVAEAPLDKPREAPTAVPEAPVVDEDAPAPDPEVASAPSEAVTEEEVASDSRVAPALSSLQERLRDVRVGAVQAPLEEARETLAPIAVRDDEVTLAEQLGLKVRRVVLDAGHGGHDTGAIGPSGVREKDVSLAVTRRLAAMLREAGLEVVLTREDDRFVRLEDRTRLANDVKGDLFISIHCNASPNRKTRGVETYTLNTSSNRYAIRLAARENASSEKGISDLQYILADLTTKANTDESSRLASRVQRALVSSLRSQHSGVKDLGHKEALFFVLLGARMPSILVETSFLSNPTEERLLASSDYQGLLASSIFNGIQTFLAEREKVAQVP